MQGQPLTVVSDHPVTLTAVEPTERGVAAPGAWLEDVMAVEAPVLAPHQCASSDQSDPRRFAWAGVAIDAHWHQPSGEHGHPPGIAAAVWTVTGEMPSAIEPVIGFAGTVVRRLKSNQDRHQFAPCQTAPVQAFTLTVLELLAVPGGQTQAAELIDIAA